MGLVDRRGPGSRRSGRGLPPARAPDGHRRCSCSSRCGAPRPRLAPPRRPSGAPSKRDLGSPVDFHVEYLDLPDETALPYARRLTDLLVEKYAGHRFDVVVVQRAEALGFLLENRQALFPGVPIVFTDVTPDDLERLKPPPDVTGAVRIVEGQRTVALALDLLPDTRQVVIVGGASPFDRRGGRVRARPRGSQGEGARASCRSTGCLSTSNSGAWPSCRTTAS